MTKTMLLNKIHYLYVQRDFSVCFQVLNKELCIHYF